jgi:hypothetical protein
MKLLNRNKPYLRLFTKIVFLWLIILLIIVLGIYLGIDKKIIGISVALFGFLTNAFAGLFTVISFIPIIGPLIVKVIALPIFWVFNGIGYFLSAFAIKRGYSKEVFNYRVLTVVFLLGVIVGFIIGSII